MMALMIMMITRPMLLMVVITSMDFGRTEYFKQKNIYDEETYVGKYKHNFNDIFFK